MKKLFNMAIDTVYVSIIIALKFIAIPIAVLGMYFAISNAIIEWPLIDGDNVVMQQIGLVIESILWSVVSVIPFVVSRTATKVKRNKKAMDAPKAPKAKK